MDPNSKVETGDGLPEPRHRFGPRLLVVARAGGVAVHTSPLAPPMPLGLSELAFLGALDGAPGGSDLEHIESCVAQVVETYRAERAALKSLLQNLRFMRLFGKRADEAIALDAPRSAPPAPPADDLDLAGFLRLHTPVVLRLHRGRYEFIGHEGGVRVALSPVETLAVGSLSLPTTRARAYADHCAKAGPHALDEDAFDALLRRLHGQRLLSNAAEDESEKVPVAGVVSRAWVERHFQQHALAQDAAEREREERTGVKRVRVVPVAFDDGPPLALGLVIAYAQAYDGGRLNERFDFRRDWVWAPDRFEVFTQRPAVYLFSNYLWSHARCAEVSARVKQVSPSSITIHGGPDTPGYPADVERHFRENPHVDIAVHGEGEIAAAQILDRLAGVLRDDGGPVDLSVLADVPGISFRKGDTVVHTAPRERIKDVDALPSPILQGFFDVYRGVPGLRVVLETNRGCPYGCTFCDWGGATMTRIRKFDLARVFGELRWVADIGASAVSVSDANFGIFPRDVEIAEEAARLRRETGAPSAFGASYAKNTVEHLKKIIAVLTDAGMLAGGVLAFQTTDKATLDAVKRSNIKKEKYDQLEVEMREARLPLVVELMFGLPGSTYASFKADLQECIDRELMARINMTSVLVNSPMNHPDYRAEHALVLDTPHGPGQTPTLIGTKTFTPDEHASMQQLRKLFMLGEHFGCLRLVSRYLRQELGLREIDFLDRLMRDAPALPEYPLLGVLVTTGDGLMAAPLSWALVLRELRSYVTRSLGAPDDSALDAILRAQHALLPSADRVLPERQALAHDVVAWHAAMIEAKRSHVGADWPRSVPRLRDLPPGELVVADPRGVVQRLLGIPMDAAAVGMHWEYDTPMARWSHSEALYESL